MDRNSAIGLTLIAFLLLAYFYWFAPSPEPPSQKPVETENAVKNSEQAKAADSQPDSATIASFGDLSGFVTGTETTTPVETENLKIVFSSKGGIIKDLELKKYKTYWQTPLKLVTPETNRFKLATTYKGKEIDLYSLYYAVEQTSSNDTTVIRYNVRLTDGTSLTQTYRIPDKGYVILYSVDQNGLDQNLSGNTLSYEWNERIRPMEKDLQDTRDNTTICYYSAADGFDYLSERSNSESENFDTPIKWISVKKKFFLSSIIAEKNFSAAQLTTLANPNDTSVVKEATAKLLIPRNEFAAGADFKYYFGPNDYQELGDVTDKFKENVYLGWPPVYWINKFVIFPVFHFLTTFIANYGLIIIILVLLLKLVLFPLSYKSYLSMAKMKVLKPELDEIKERNGEDMAKTQQDQLKLYQQVGVNPISGCIPVLLQMPILFAMFYLFPASIELRQQPFLWAEDLSTYDSIIQLGFAIPFLGSHISLFTLLMTVSTLIYTWQNNQISSVQGPMKSMSYIMPVIFFFVLNRFSAGLTFYYFVSNLVTFAQQAIIRRFVDENKIKLLLEENRKKNLAGSGKKSKFMSKLEDAMKASEEARKRAEDERKKRKK